MRIYDSIYRRDPRTRGRPFKAKLTREQVRQIRASTASRKWLAFEFKVDYMTIHRIKNKTP